MATLWGTAPDPAACLDTALSMKHVLVAGNHDLAAVGRISLADFNPYAAEACLWTRDRLSPEHRDRLAELPLQAEQAPFTLVHGSPRDPVWEYVVSQDVALACFDHFTTTHCLVGHSHVPFVCRLDEHGLEFARVHAGSCVPLGSDRLIINPGGVGQPRDGDPRASYAIYHVEESIVEFRRVGLRRGGYSKEDARGRAAGVSGGAAKLRTIAPVFGKSIYTAAAVPTS